MTQMGNIIKVNGALLDAFSVDISKTAGELETKLDELRSKLDTVQWEGSDRQQYEIQRQQWTVASRDLFQLLHRIGQTVQLAKTNYGGTETTNAKMFMA